MNTTITVRNVDPVDKSWLMQEARRNGTSMEEFVRRLFRECRKNSEQHSKPSDVFRQYFGPEHGIDLPLDQRFSYRPILFSNDDETENDQT